jgi:LysR family hydrogen peroxide-inducible transcriptional activator
VAPASAGHFDEEGHCLRDQALEVCGLTGAIERASFRGTSFETLRQMVGADVGMTLLPEFATLNQDALSSSIRLLSFSDSNPNRQIRCAGANLQRANRFF